MAKFVQEVKQQRSVNSKYTLRAYANMYASAVCSGKVTPGGKKKNRKSYGWWYNGKSMRSMYGSEGGSVCAQIKGFGKAVKSTSR